MCPVEPSEPSNRDHAEQQVPSYKSSPCTCHQRNSLIVIILPYSSSHVWIPVCEAYHKGYSKETWFISCSAWGPSSHCSLGRWMLSQCSQSKDFCTYQWHFCTDLPKRASDGLGAHCIPICSASKQAVSATFLPRDTVKGSTWSVFEYIAEGTAKLCVS